MSLMRSVPITCPFCGKISNFTRWDSINTELNPEMKAAVRDRSAFRFICPECGSKSYVDYDFLSHQMEDRIMIQYASSDEDAEKFYNLFTGKTKPNKMLDTLKSGYLIRIVRSLPELLEKLAIFDAGLDDRIVKIIKLFMMLDFQTKHPDWKNISTCFFTDEGKHFIQLFTEGKLKAELELSPDVYNAFLDV